MFANLLPWFIRGWLRGISSFCASIMMCLGSNSNDDEVLLDGGSVVYFGAVSHGHGERDDVVGLE